MKVAFIGQKGIPAISGGVEKHVETIAIKMADLRHGVFVYVRSNYTTRKIKNYKGVKIIHLPSIATKHLDAISHTFLATIHALFQSYDVIHFQAIGPTSLSWIVKLFRPGIALISTFHCQDYYHQKWNWIAKLYLRFGEYISCNVPDKTITVSKLLKAHVLKKYKKSAVMIPNGAEMKKVKGCRALDKYKLKKKKYILSVSRLVKHKGIHYLIEAFKKLEDTSRLPNDFKLVIVGDGFHTDEYVKYLKFISIGRKNIIFTGSKSGKALDQLYANAYLFIQPSESEGLSLALLEAMGHGVATLVSDIPENLEAVGKTGFSFKSKDANNLRDKLAYALIKPNEVRSAAKAAQEKVMKDFSWETIVKKTLEVYKELIFQKKTKKYVWHSKKA